MDIYDEGIHIPKTQSINCFVVKTARAALV